METKKADELKGQLSMLYQAAANALLSKQQHDACQQAAQALMDHLEEFGKADVAEDSPSES